MPLRQLVAYAVLGMLLSVLSIAVLDYKLAPMVQVSGDTAVAVWSGITEFGDSAYMAVFVLTIWAVSFALGNVQPENLHWPVIRKKAALVFAAVAVPGIASMIIKFIVGRGRPYMGDIGFHPFTQGSDFASWPSGHTTTAFAFAVVVGLVIPALRWPLLLVAALTGYSRMALGMHYLGDVIAGVTLGSVGAVLVYRWLAPKLKIKT